MPIMTELVVSIVGGVITAMILGLFSRRESGSAHVQQPVATSPEPRTRSAFGDIVRLVLAVVGGFIIALLAGRMLIQAGVIPRGMPSRLGLMVVGTVLCWLLLSMGRRR
ncbi:MAG: hypothetical protein AAGB04_19910 [Pseudomonadota bacterium]